MEPTSPSTRPGWQVDGLEEEWIEQTIEIDEQDPDNQPIIEVSGGRFEDPYPGLSSGSNSPNAGSNESEDAPSPQVGTFVIRSDQPAMQLEKVKRHQQGVKDFFSPLALEKMFEPPPAIPYDAHTSSPSPAFSRFNKPSTAVFAPSKLAQQLLMDPTLTEIAEDEEPTNSSTTQRSVPRGDDTILETDLPNLGAIDGKFMPPDYQFTFSPPTIAATSTPLSDAGDGEAAPSNALKDALTDPRLKLFQLNYDTYTREHLSAIVDSIPIMPSRSGSVDAEPRNPKRIRLSPASEFDDDGKLSPIYVQRRDYVGESRSLMSAIRKNTRSVSLELSETDKSRATAATRKISSSTAATAVEPASFLTVDSPYARPESAPAALTAGTYRQNAAAFMSAIKSSLQADRSHIRGLSSSTVASATGKENLDVSDNSLKPEVQDSPPWKEKRRRKSDPTPRKLVARISTGGDVESEVAAEFSVLSISVDITSAQLCEPDLMQAQRLAVPSPHKSASFGSVEIVANHMALGPSPRFPPAAGPAGRTTSQTSSLNRFISNSTTTTANSVPSLVKHQGQSQRKLTNITPADVPNLTQKVSGMKYDSQSMKWVRDRTPNRDQTGESEDVFRDFESLSTSRSRKSQRVEDNSSLSITDAGVVEVMTGVSSLDLDEEGEPLTSDDEFVRQPDEVSMYPETLDGSDTDDGSYRPPAESEGTGSELGSSDEETEPYHPTSDSGANSPLRQATSPPRDINTPLPHRRPEIVPRSALKSTSSTPVAQIVQGGHRRSVSFSDGRKAGRIQGLHTDDSGSITQSESSEALTDRNQTRATGAGLISARTKGIQARLDELCNDSLGDTPSKMIKPRTAHRHSFPIAATSAENQSQSRRGFARSPSVKAYGSVAKGNATFLTECSFGVAHDKLVQIITDVQPFEPYWESLNSIDLSQKLLESTARLKEFLPNLVDVKLDSNRLAWLSGLPAGLKRLSVKANMLTGLTSYSHIKNLEVLDISGNEVDGISQLSDLERLRELTANGNSITSVDELKSIRTLTHLSLRKNKITSVEFAHGTWPALHTLDLTDNALSLVKGVHRAPSLQVLILENNSLTEFRSKSTLPILQVLRLSGNRLKMLDVSPFPRLRTLYVDHNSCEVAHLEELCHLRNLSLRYQRRKNSSLSLSGCRVAKRAYLSGNPITSDVKPALCPNLVYLEMAGCRLSSLPEGFAAAIQNVEVLNLNYNFLTDLTGLAGLVRLRKLTVVGSRINGTKALVRAVQKLPHLELVDFRMNPATLEFYLPLMIRTHSGDPPTATAASSSSAQLAPGGLGDGREKSWADQDARFRRSLPDATYVKRMAYRGVLMRICAHLQTLDGVVILGKERKKAEMLLQGLENV